MMARSQEFALLERDVRRLVGLLGKICISEGGIVEKRRQTMDGLCNLIDADRWVWLHTPLLKPGEKVIPTGIQHGGFSTQDFAKYLSVIEHPDLAEMNASFLEVVATKPGSHHTRIQAQLDPENRFPSMPVFQLWTEAGLGTVLLSARKIQHVGMSFVAIYREHPSASFSEREARIAHILLSELPWLHYSEHEHGRVKHHDELSPRIRQVVNLLLEGHSRKQIATQLGLSEHTVSGYVKEVYKTYKVHTQTELMRYFQFGDGGDGLR